MCAYPNKPAGTPVECSAPLYSAVWKMTGGGQTTQNVEGNCRRGTRLPLSQWERGGELLSEMFGKLFCGSQGFTIIGMNHNVLFYEVNELHETNHLTSSLTYRQDIEMIRHQVSEETCTPYRIHDRNLDASVLSDTSAPPDNKYNVLSHPWQTSVVQCSF